MSEPLYTADEVTALVNAAVDKVYEELGLPPRDPAWEPLDSIPRDGTPFVMLVQHTFRWNPYKDLGKVKATIGKKAQKLGDGTTGRWQVIDDKGMWVNTLQPKGVWRA